MEQSRKYNWIAQAFIWSSLWLLLGFVLGSGTDNYSRIFYRSLITNTGVFAIVSLNVGVIFPKFYLQKKLWLYFLFSVFALVLITWLVHFDQMPWAEYVSRKPKHLQGMERIFDEMKEVFRPRGARGSFMKNMRWVQYSSPLLISLLGSTLVEATRHANQKEKEAIRSDKEKLETELKFLKSQINPHFLFNVLNNIYTLSVIKSEKTPDSLLQLSNLLRYMLYDSNEAFVPIKQEVEYLKNYVELYRLKDSRGLNISMSLDESRTEIRIAPLLFIPFLENAFKHSKVEDLNKGFVKAELKTGEYTVEFTVENSIPENDIKKDTVGGIGLTNIQKRLALIYPDRHELKIERSENRFRIYLRIQL